jgi:hypothetical protein
VLCPRVVTILWPIWIIELPSSKCIYWIIISGYCPCVGFCCTPLNKNIKVAANIFTKYSLLYSIMWCLHNTNMLIWEVYIYFIQYLKPALIKCKSIPLSFMAYGFRSPLVCNYCYMSFHNMSLYSVWKLWCNFIYVQGFYENVKVCACAVIIYFICFHKFPE